MTETSQKEIYTAFIKAQKGFAPALKESVNPHFKNKYASLASCVDAVIDALNENDIALIQETDIGENCVIVETRFIHASGQSMTGGKLRMPVVKNDPQGYGSALTYARRYSLMAAAGIAPEDDDGNEASRQMPIKKAQRDFELTVRPNLIEQAKKAAESGLDAYAAFYKTILNDLERDKLKFMHLELKDKAQKADSAKIAPTETQGE
jgi:hypothetical protein